MKALNSWPVRLAFASEDDAELHRRWWRPRLSGFMTFGAVFQVPEVLRPTYNALKALLMAEVGR